MRPVTSDEIDAILNDLSSPDTVTRLRAIVNLVRLGDPRSITYLKKVAEDDPEILLRNLAIQGTSIFIPGIPEAGTAAGHIPTIEEFSLAAKEAEKQIASPSYKKSIGKSRIELNESSLEGTVEDLSTYQRSEYGRDTLTEPVETDRSGSEAPQPDIRTLELGGKGKYVVSDEVGHGGMGVILNAFDTDIQRDVAMKVISSSWQDSREYTERFIKEAQVQGQLEHPNICPVHELGKDGNGRIYFTMKMVKGYSLAQMIQKSREDGVSQNPKRLTEILNNFLKICDGITFAHSKGIIHRDLKPDNIMVGDFGEIYVMDWGLVRIVGTEDDEHEYELAIDNRSGQDDTIKTLVGSVVGTPAYMPPEQAAGLVWEMDMRSDIYSLGALLYELLALEPPFPDENAWEVLGKIRFEKPPPPSSHAPAEGISPELDHIVMKCLAKAKEMRYQTVRELKQEVELFLSGRPIGAMEYSSWQVFAKWFARNKVISTAVLAVVIVIMVSASIAYVNMSRAWKSEQDARVRAEENARVAIASRAVAEERRTEAEVSELKSRFNLAMVREEKKEIGEAVRLYREIKRDIIANRIDIFPFIDLAIWRARYNEGRSIVEQMTISSENLPSRCVCFRPQSRELAIGCGDGTIRLSDQESGEILSLSKGKFAPVTCLAFDPGGGLLAAGYGDSTLRVWDVTNLVEYACLKDPSLQHDQAHARPVTCLAFSSDGRRLVSSGDEVIKLWDVEKKRVIRQLWGHLRNVLSVAFSPDGNSVASGGKDGLVHLWDVENGKLIRVLYQHPTPVKKVAFSPDGKTLLSVSEDTAITLWDLVDNREIELLKGHETDVTALDINPDGTVLAAGCGDSTVRFWDIKRQIDIASFKEHAGEIISVVFNHNGTAVATVGTDQAVKIWSMTRETIVKTISLADEGTKIMTVDFSPDGRMLAAGVWAPKLVPVFLIDVGTSETVARLLSHGGRVNHVDFNPDGTLLATASDDGLLRLANVGTGEQAAMINVYEETSTSLTGILLEAMKVFGKSPRGLWKSVNCAVFSPGGTMIATASDDASVKLWDAKNMECLHTFTECEEAVYTVVFSPNGRLLAGGGESQNLFFWDVESMSHTMTLLGHGGGVKELSFSPDGRFIAAGAGRDISLWHIASQKQICTLSGHLGGINSMVFSPDGRLLATASDDTSIKLWDVAKAECLLTLNEHTGNVEAVVFSPDYRFLASGSQDCTIKLWNLGEALKPLLLQEEPVHQCIRTE